MAGPFTGFGETKNVRHSVSTFGGDFYFTFGLGFFKVPIMLLCSLDLSICCRHKLRCFVHIQVKGLEYFHQFSIENSKRP
jgi:hypothetical protein